MSNSLKVIETIINKQISQNKVSHAYLLLGKGSNEMAQKIAKTLLCEDQVWAGCGICGACQRVESQSHGDLQIVSGVDESIKKDEILKLKHNFVQSSLEKTNRQVYIIEAVDNSSTESMNSLLKYLEEPEGVTTAILTSENENRVLETIKSRCLILKMPKSDYRQIYNELLEEGFDSVDSFYLAHLPQARELDYFNEVKDMVHEFMGYLRQHRVVDAVLFLQVEGIKNKRIDRERMVLFCDILELLLSFKSRGSKELSQSLEGFSNREALLESVISVHDRIRPGVNIGLILDQLVYEVMNIDKARKF